MLTRICLSTFLLLAIAPPYASAGFDTDRDNEGSATGTVTAEDSVTVNRGSGSRLQPQACTRAGGQVVPCQSDLGWWSNTYRCYLTAISQAAPDDAAHAGETFFRCDPGPLGWDGAVQDPQLFLWLEPGAAGPDPRVLAFEAIDQMRLLGIEIAMAPPVGTEALVNAPVWLWAAEPGADTWGPATASASAGGVTVSAVARAQQVAWAMGDGATVVCGQGDPYEIGAVPSCIHTYRSPGTRTLTATTTWSIDWSSSTGVQGVEQIETFSTATIDVREARARVTARE